MQLPDKLNAFADEQRDRMVTTAPRVGIVDGAVAVEQMSGLVSLFPNVAFESVGATWPDRPIRSPGILIIALDAAIRDDIDSAIRRLRSGSPIPVVIVLRHADVMVTRALVQAGAEDVLPTPVSDAALALCIDRILQRQTSNREPGKSGQVIALLKAGGGVGATSVGVQVASMLARRTGKPGQVCFADFDLQFGTGALYFDIADGLTVADCLAVGDFLGETQFATALAEHKSGARVLAAPREPTALDILTPQSTEALINGLRRDFAYTILDLPSVWTAWTNRALQFADRIVLVTHLSVPHMHLTRRQLAVLSMQRLDEIPLTLVCNGVTSEQQDMLSIKSAERAIQHKIDIVVPEDGRLMGASTNQGLELSVIRRGTKLEKAISLVADVLVANTLASVRR